MRIAFPPPPPESLRRLEAAAAAHPGRYRAQLALLALTGDAVLAFVRVFPLAAPIAVGALFVNNTYITALSIVAILFLIWVMRPGMRDSGESIVRTYAPELFAALDELKKTLDVGARIDVRLSDEVNAGAGEVRGLFGVAGVRRTLTLGVPLLALLGRDEARAVIAHEFGHFSRQHGRLGHWLYRAHLGWLSYAARIDQESSAFERAGAVFAEMFVPAFSRRAMVWSRRCEYEADADAARAIDGAPLIGALARLDLYGAWYSEEFPRIVRGWQCAEPAAPDDYLGRMVAAFEATPPDILARLEAEEAAHSDDWLDTHPQRAKRAAALGVQPGFTPRENPCGTALLGAMWPRVAADYNARWRKENAAAWSVAHTRYRLIEAPLIAAESETVAGWPVAQRLERAKALRRLEPARGLADLVALHEAAPGDDNVAFACASARLADGDAGAVETLRMLPRTDASWRVPVYARLMRHHERSGDRARANGWANQLERASELEMRAHAAVCNDIASGKHDPTTRPSPMINTVRAGLTADPAVAKAWLIESKAPLDAAGAAAGATLKVDALILVVDPFDAEQQPCDDLVIRNRHRQVLADLIEPNALPVVMSYYTTEPLPAALRASLERLPADSAYVR